MSNAVIRKLNAAFPGKQWRLPIDNPTYDRWEWLEQTAKPSQAAFDAAVAGPDPQPADRSDVNNLERGLKALALTFAQITGTPVAQVRNIFKQKYDSLG